MMNNNQWMIYKFFTSLIWVLLVGTGFYINLYVGLASLTLGLISINLSLYSGFKKEYSAVRDNVSCLTILLTTLISATYFPHWLAPTMLLTGAWIVWFMERILYKNERFLNLQQAIMTHKFVKRAGASAMFCYYKAATGPYKDLVDCSYFVTLEDGILSFSTSAPDMYAEEILATDYEVCDITEEEILYAKELAEKLG